MRNDPERLNPREKPKRSLPPLNPEGATQRSWAFGMSVVGGVVLGGQFLSVGIVAEVLRHTSYLTEYQQGALAEFSFIPGGLIFGVLIPAEIYRRSYHLSWTDLWRRINS